MSEIDVSKCELIYNDGRCFASQRQGVGYSCHKSDYCKYNTNCYYKQLQQLQQQLQLEKDNVAELNELLISYKEENEELKRQCESLKGLITVGGKQQFALTQRVDELEQKLEKIKDYCKNKTLSYCDCSKEILQIIEE